jgi:DNA-binding NtrC family response regulator
LFTAFELEIASHSRWPLHLLLRKRSHTVHSAPTEGNPFYLVPRIFHFWLLFTDTTLGILQLLEPSIIAVSQDSCFLSGIAGRLAAREIVWVRTKSGKSAISAISRYQPKLVIMDSGSGSNSRVLDSVNRIRERYPTLPIFLIARKSSEALAIGALKAGVDDYFKVPLCAENLLACIDRRLFSCTGQIQSSQDKANIEARMVGNSSVMTDLKKHLKRVSMVDSTVLITGETGTGKELAAGLIHENSDRRDQSMISVNCAALPDNLVESELFGYERGAFTGAVATTRGRFEHAQGGTVFLDEIGDMTPFAQAKILRVIEDKQISHLGGAKTIKLDFRLIAATNRDPDILIEESDFRDDLFYRLNVARLHMPSLRAHIEDIPLLIEHGIRKLNRKFNRSIKGIREDVLKLLLRYVWPGNVRELMNVLEGAYINLPEKRIHYADLPVHFKKKLTESQLLPSNERKKILSALLETNWNKSTAASKLNWSRMTLYRKMTKHRIVEKRSRRRAAL